jgi:iron complex outermembrane receptor protein
VAGEFQIADNPAISVKLEYYDTKYRYRIDQPVFGGDVLSRNDARQFVIADPTPAQQALACTNNQSLGGEEACLHAHVDYVIDGRLHNLSSLLTNGLHSEVRFAWQTGKSIWDVDLISSYILKYTTIDNSGPRQLLNSPGYPIAFRALATVGFERGGMSTRTLAHYTNGYHDFIDQPPRDVRSWLTVDEILSWRIASADTKSTESITFSVVASNVFNKTPPFVNLGLGLGFDPANARDIGRQVAFRVAMQW